MKVSTENDNNFGYEKNTIFGDNMPLKIITESIYFFINGKITLILTNDIHAISI